MSRLQPFGSNIWIADGPTVNFFTFPYPTRMVVIKLRDGSGAWIWSPIEISDELAVEVEKTVGPVRHLVSPNVIHWIYLKQWKDRFPNAKLYASPGLEKRRVVKDQDLKFDATLTNQPDPSYSDDIEQLVFEGGFFNEVIFFHKASKTAIVTDLIQRFPEETAQSAGFKGWLMKLDGLVGPNGTAPGELRFLFWIHGDLPKARKNLDRILYEWQPEKLIIAHGENASQDATEVIANSFRWVPLNPQERFCCCVPKHCEETSKED